MYTNIYIYIYTYIYIYIFTGYLFGIPHVLTLAPPKLGIERNALAQEHRLVPFFEWEAPPCVY